MKVREIMTTRVITTTPETTLGELVGVLMEHNYHTLPVVDERQRVVGTVKYEDIMKIFVPHPPSLQRLLKSTHFYNIEEEDILASEISADLGEKVTVEDIMDTDVITVDENDSVSRARVLMKQHNVERMPVVSGDRLTGFITLFDIIVAVFREKGVIG